MIGAVCPMRDFCTCQHAVFNIFAELLSAIKATDFPSGAYAIPVMEFVDKYSFRKSVCGCASKIFINPSLPVEISRLPVRENASAATTCLCAGMV